MTATRALSKGIEREGSPGVRCVLLIRDGHHRVIEIAAARESGSEKSSNSDGYPVVEFNYPKAACPVTSPKGGPAMAIRARPFPSDDGTYPEMNAVQAAPPATGVTRGRTPRSGLPGDACPGMVFTRGWPSPGKIELPGDASTRFSSQINLPGDDVSPTWPYEMVIRRRPIVRRRAGKRAGATVWVWERSPGAVTG
jgi:hypothetical protein